MTTSAGYYVHYNNMQNRTALVKLQGVIYYVWQRKSFINNGSVNFKLALCFRGAPTLQKMQ